MKKIIYLFVFIILSMIAVAQPPDFTPQANPPGEHLEIVYPQLNLYTQNLDLDLNFHVFNSSGKLLTSEVDFCTFHLYNSTNKHIIEMNLTLEGDEFVAHLKNFTHTKGQYPYVVWCVESIDGEYGFVSDVYTIGSLQDITTNDSSVLAIALIVLGLPFLLIYISSKLDTKADKDSAVPLIGMINTILWAGAFLCMLILLILLYGIALSYSVNDTLLGPIRSLFTYGLWTIIILLFLMTFGIGSNFIYKAYLWMGEYFNRRPGR